MGIKASRIKRGDHARADACAQAQQLHCQSERESTDHALSVSLLATKRLSPSTSAQNKDTGKCELKFVQVKARFRRPAEAGERHVHSRLRAPEEHGGEGARRCNATAGTFQESRRGKLRTCHCRRLQHLGLPIEEVWEETLLILPPDVVPMWDQMKISGDVCGSIITQNREPSWRVAKHGSFQLNRDKMQMKETDQAAHLHVYIHFCEARAAWRNVCRW